jgi:hypothetical protein
MRNYHGGKRAFLALFGSSVIAGAIFGTPSIGRTFDRMVHASACFYGYEDVRVSAKENFYDVSNEDTERTATLFCPVPSDTSLWHDDVSAANVYGYATGSGDVSVRACITYVTSSGGSCSGAATTSAAGNYQLTPDLDPWSENPNAFPYLAVALNPKDGDANTLRGFAIVE